MSVPTITQITPLDNAHWQAVLKIYRASFPDWEREPETTLRTRTLANRYAVYCAFNEDRIVSGFYILDIHQALRYAVFCFLAVDQKYRGLGYGRALCRDAISRFNNTYSSIDWLFVEAENKQAIFYGRHGFRKINIPYRIPSFSGSETIPMHLMAISKTDNKYRIEKKHLKKIIQHIFVSGYQLNENDSRTQQQLALIPKQAQLIRWPQ